MKSITIAAIAGLAAAASAQGVTLTFAASDTSVNVGETISWTVTASFTGYGSTAYYGGYLGTFDASDPSVGVSGNFMSGLQGEGTPPTAAGASVTTLNFFNSALLGTDDQSNPIQIFSFDVVTSSQGSLSYAADGINTIFPDDNIFTLGDEHIATVVTDTVSIVPAPGALALLGLGGLAAARRRR